MAFSTGISRTRLKSRKHKWSWWHHDLNCNSSYSEYCLSFMMLLQAPLLSTYLAFPDAVQAQVSAQIQAPSVAAEDQDLTATQSCSSGGGAGLTQCCWAQLCSPTTSPPHRHRGQGYMGIRTAQTRSRPTPWAGWRAQGALRSSAACGRHGSVFSAASLKAPSTDIATRAGRWAPGVGPCWSCKGKMA